MPPEQLQFINPVVHPKRGKGSWATHVLEWQLWCLYTAPGIVRSIFLMLTMITLKTLRWWMDGFCTWYTTTHWLTNPINYAQDNVSVMEGVASISLESYGPGLRETCHILTPTSAVCKPVLKPTPALVYLHGGGFILANRYSNTNFAGT